MKRPVPMESASAFIDEKIKQLGDWRGKALAKVRAIAHGSSGRAQFHCSEEGACSLAADADTSYATHPQRAFSRRNAIGLEPTRELQGD